MQIGLGMRKNGHIKFTCPAPRRLVCAFSSVALAEALNSDSLPDQNAVWLYAGEDRQALVLFRRDPRSGLVLRYLPVARLEDGTMHDW